MKKSKKKVSKVKKTPKKPLKTVPLKVKPKMGRPRKYETKKILSISLDNNLYKDLCKYAKTKELKTSQVIQHLVTNAIQLHNLDVSRQLPN